MKLHPIKKHFWAGLLTAIVLLCPVFGVHAESIDTFAADILIDTTGQLHVTETITYDFGSLEKHGIYREVPYSYRSTAGSKYVAAVKVLSVVDENGGAYRYDVSRSGGYVKIKIGDPDQLVTGIHTYVVEYTVNDAVKWFDGEPEVYWNVTGNNWLVDLADVSVRVHSDITIDSQKVKCFTGDVGSSDSNCEITPLSGVSGVNVTAGPIYSGEGLTFALRLPAGSILEPTQLSQTLKFVGSNWPVVLPFIILFILIALYRKYGRDPRGRGTIVPEYEPPKDMSPGLLGYLIDEKIDPRDITATILNLAVKGHLKIQYEAKKLGRDTYRLIKQQGAGSDITEFEQALLAALFQSGDNVALSDLKTTLPAKLPGIKEKLKKEAEARGFFDRHSSRVRNGIMVIGSVMLFIGIFSFGSSIILAISLLISGGLVAAFYPALARRTQAGVLAKEQIQGFKRFLTVTEEQRLKFHNAPARKPEQFMSFLPFAVALGVERDWAKQFEGITIEQPDWYTGNSWNTFNAYIFVSSLHNFSSTAQSQAFTAPAPRSSGFSGGGFSGGGFGGGGGGSW